MKNFAKIGLFTVLSTVLLAGPVKAEYFVVRDPETKLGAAYPDTWRRVHNQKPDEVFSFAAPGVSDFAGCRVRVRAEERFKIYPARFSDNLARTVLDKEFWEEYLAENRGYRINDLHMNTGLSRGFGSHVHANYMSYDDPGQQKQAVIFASLYNNNVYVVDCSSKIEVFDKWYPQFMSFIKSVSFDKQVHELPNGHYRPFMMDCPTWVRNGPDIFHKRDVDLKKYW